MLINKLMNNINSYRTLFQKNGNLACVSNYQPVNTKLLYTPARDTFSFSANKADTVPTPKIQASGKDFLKRFKRTGLSEQEFIELVQAKGKFCGEGRYSTVYSIPVVGMENYVLKWPTEVTNSKNKKIKSTERAKAVELVKNAFPGENFGQKIAEMGNFQILLKVEGKVCGIPMWKEDKAPEKIEKIYGSYLRKVANMPQKAYDDLARKIHKVNRKGYFFDWGNANNVLINIKNKEFNLVDLESRRNASNLSFIDMAYCLTDTGSASSFGLKQRHFDELRQTILKKCAIASINTGHL